MSPPKSTALARVHQAPMTQAAETLASVCRLIDEGANPRDAVVATMFAEGRNALSRAVDSHIEAKAIAEGMFETAKRAKAEWEKRRKRMDEIVKAIDAEMLAALTEEPDLPYSGRLGSVKLVTNPGVLVTAWGDRELTSQLVEMFGVAEHYYSVTTTYKLDVEEVKRGLRAGAQIDWAAIKQDQRVEVSP